MLAATWIWEITWHIPQSGGAASLALKRTLMLSFCLAVAAELLQQTAIAHWPYSQSKFAHEWNEVAKPLNEKHTKRLSFTMNETALA